MIRHRGSLVFDEEIFASDPDEVAFDYRFKDVTLTVDRLVVTSKTSKHLLELSVSSLLEKNRPNKAPEPTPTAVMPPAAQESRRL